VSEANFQNTAIKLSRTPLGIVALFIVLIYGFASFVVVFAGSDAELIIPVVWFLVVFPFFVLASFMWLVLSGKAYGPGDFRNEDNFLKWAKPQLEAAGAYINAAYHDEVKSGAELKASQGLSTVAVDAALETISNRFRMGAPQKNIVLWVDDRPDNNIFERSVFEKLGFEFDLAETTNEAINMLRQRKYDAIISDMGRREGEKEGYVLLSKVRKNDSDIPFFIYAGSNSSEHRRMAFERGAQGSTNRSQELISMVTNALEK